MPNTDRLARATKAWRSRYLEAAPPPTPRVVAAAINKPTGLCMLTPWATVVLTAVFSLSAPDNAPTRQPGAPRGSLEPIPRGIAAHCTTSATPTTEPTAGLEKRAFRASAISKVTKPSRPWCVTGPLTRRRRVQYVKRLRTGVLVALPPGSDTPGRKSVGSTCATCSARARHGLTLALTGPGVPFFGSLSRIAGRVDALIGAVNGRSPRPRCSRLCSPRRGRYGRRHAAQPYATPTTHPSLCSRVPLFGPRTGESVEGRANPCVESSG